MLRGPVVVLALLTLILAAAIASFAADAPSEAGHATQWLTSYDEAMKLAKARGKPILARFCGSDWNATCIKQEQEVFSTDEFKKWAGENVILLLVDSPTRKAQDDATKRQNQELKKKFTVKNLPTVVLVNGEAQELVRIAGYKPGSGPKKFIESANAGLAESKPRVQGSDQLLKARG